MLTGQLQAFTDAETINSLQPSVCELIHGKWLENSYSEELCKENNNSTLEAGKRRGHLNVGTACTSNSQTKKNKGNMPSFTTVQTTFSIITNYREAGKALCMLLSINILISYFLYALH
ncbi:hypothetical protein CHARACLAT_026091 [Characodon lateralis]|uniref:Uncharacterized protein n=1 Tax=Characodon lateralis TaxID=208331 RepID=A0ABU7E6W1_9TELE|nr:hypothetical protein [Characodon lateralis]